MRQPLKTWQTHFSHKFQLVLVFINLIIYDHAIHEFSWPKGPTNYSRGICQFAIENGNVQQLKANHPQIASLPWPTFVNHQAGDVVFPADNDKAHPYNEPNVPAPAPSQDLELGRLAGRMGPTHPHPKPHLGELFFSEFLGFNSLVFRQIMANIDFHCQMVVS